VQVEGIVEDINYTNIQRLMRDVDLVIDGLDNLETRYLLNDAALRYNKPWIYGAAVATQGMTMNVIPGETPCLRCIFPSLPEAGTTLTCDTAGVIASAPIIVASLQFVEALKFLTGAKDQLSRALSVIDVWDGGTYRLEVERSATCPTCGGNYEFLQAQSGTRATSLCGQNAVQVLNTSGGKLSFPDLARRLSNLGTVSYNDFMFRFTVDGHEMVLFPDGRAIVKGTNDQPFAKGLYAKYIGS
jgi:adenylyltransferase/sulfurtransferase